MCKNKAPGKFLRGNLGIAFVIISITVSFFTVSCKKSELKRDVIEINEKLFISQINDVYLNTEDYLGKTIKLEGIFKKEQYNEEEGPYYFVIRYGPGCCGSDGNVGFEVKWDNNKTQPYPAVESWVAAEGLLMIDNDTYLYLDLILLTELNKRGRETVFQ